MKPHVYRKGDIVTVIDPLVVVRVGYPLFLGDVIEQMEKEHTAAVNEFIGKLGYLVPMGNLDAAIDSKLSYEIIQALAGAHMRKVGFGGKERSLHTETIEAYRNTRGWEVLSRRVVKTGTYCHGSYSSYDEDYTPPYLSNERTRILLTLEHGEHRELERMTIEIEAANVELEVG